MANRAVLQKQAAKKAIILGLLTSIGLMSGCEEQPVRAAPPAPPLPSSHWGANYFYNFEPPQKRAPASVKATIIVVNPFYKDAESALIDPTYAQVGKGFSKSMGVDLDKIIIAKGMTSVGPYLTLDDVTYPDKKNADITLAPRVFLTTETKYDKWEYVRYSGNRDSNMDANAAGANGEAVYSERKFELKIGGWVAYEMREPLSGEKMWVKKLELEESVVTGAEIYEAKPVYETKYGGQYNNEPYQDLVRYDQGTVVYNGRADAVADALKKYYPIIMGKAWTYIDTDEIINLKEKTKEIRQLKRY